MNIRSTPWRDNNFCAPGWSEKHRDRVDKIIGSLVDENERRYATYSVVWGNYPELSAKETASAALDNYGVI